MYFSFSKRLFYSVYQSLILMSLHDRMNIFWLWISESTDLDRIITGIGDRVLLVILRLGIKESFELLDYLLALIATPEMTKPEVLKGYSASGDYH